MGRGHAAKRGVVRAGACANSARRFALDRISPARCFGRPSAEANGAAKSHTGPLNPVGTYQLRLEAGAPAHGRWGRQEWRAKLEAGKVLPLSSFPGSREIGMVSEIPGLGGYVSA